MEIHFHVVHLYSASMDNTILLKFFQFLLILSVILDNTTIALYRASFEKTKAKSLKSL